MTGNGDWPFGITPENYPEFIGRCSEHITRKGKDLEGYFKDRPEPDGVIYEVYESDAPGNICLALTVIRPGKVGNEYHMTKGHFHENGAAGELYFCISGKGLVILQTKDGRTSSVRLLPGTAASIPPGWAHRTVNTGEGELVLLAAYPADAGHDYAAIKQQGFKLRVVEEEGQTKII